MREVLEVTHLKALTELQLVKPARLAFLSPGRGGPFLFQIRQAVVRLGRVRFSGTAGRTFVDVDPGEPEEPLIALDTIVRSDATGLERMLLSALPYVDEIVLGVDGRSDPETLKVAQAYADCCYVFEAADIGMSAEAWAADKIDFAAARNVGRAKVQSPWTLVVDSDEFIESSQDLRALVRIAPAVVGCYDPVVKLVDQGVTVFEARDHQRLARTAFRWRAAVHNHLVVTDSAPPVQINTVVISDTSLRTQAEQDRRFAQRDLCVEDLATNAADGDLGALFHLAKHKAGKGDVETAVKLAEDFRLRTELNGPLAWQRQWVAMTVAFTFYKLNNLDEANRWACRALLDGPSVPAFCLLGDVAEDEGDLGRALTWYEAACAINDRKEMNWPGATEVRWGRRAALRDAVARAVA